MSSEAASLVDAAKNASRALGLSEATSDLAIASCLQVVYRICNRSARRGLDLRRIASAGDIPLFELRAAVVSAEDAQARIFFVWPEDSKVAIGVLLRFKRLEGDRAQIRAWQNQDIDLALALAKQALRETELNGG